MAGRRDHRLFRGLALDVLFRENPLAHLTSRRKVAPRFRGALVNVSVVTHPTRYRRFAQGCFWSRTAIEHVQMKHAIRFFVEPGSYGCDTDITLLGEVGHRPREQLMGCVSPSAPAGATLCVEAHHFELPRGAEAACSRVSRMRIERPPAGDTGREERPRTGKARETRRTRSRHDPRFALCRARLL
jgi:hypothetical protein